MKIYFEFSNKIYVLRTVSCSSHFFIVVQTELKVEYLSVFIFGFCFLFAVLSISIVDTRTLRIIMFIVAIVVIRPLFLLFSNVTNTTGEVGLIE